MNSQSRTPGATESQNQNAGRVGASVNASSTVYHRSSMVLNPRTGTPVGLLRNENGIVVFERTAEESKHRLRLFGGSWCLEIPLVDHLESLGATWIRVTTDTGRTLCAPLSEFRERGRRIEFTHGSQLALPERYFTDRSHPIAPEPTLPFLEDPR